MRDSIEIRAIKGWVIYKEVWEVCSYGFREVREGVSSVLFFPKLP